MLNLPIRHLPVGKFLSERKAIPKFFGTKDFGKNDIQIKKGENQ